MTYDWNRLLSPPADGNRDSEEEFIRTGDEYQRLRQVGADSAETETAFARFMDTWPLSAVTYLKLRGMELGIITSLETPLTLSVTLQVTAELEKRRGQTRGDK